MMLSAVNTDVMVVGAASFITELFGVVLQALAYRFSALFK